MYSYYIPRGSLIFWGGPITKSLYWKQPGFRTTVRRPNNMPSHGSCILGPEAVYIATCYNYVHTAALHNSEN